MSERAKSVKQLVVSVINVSKSILIIPAVCVIEDPVGKENNRNQWFTICHDNDMGGRGRIHKATVQSYPNL